MLDVKVTYGNKIQMNYLVDEAAGISKALLILNLIWNYLLLTLTNIGYNYILYKKNVKLLLLLSIV